MSKEVHRIYFCKDGAILDTQIREGEDVTDTLKRCFKKISDLETKLAESERKTRRVENWQRVEMGMAKSKPTTRTSQPRQNLVRSRYS